MTSPSRPNPESMAQERCFANARLVLPDRVMPGALHIADGRIAQISEGTGIPPGAIDFDGDFLLPGLIELHTDNLERHIEPRPGVALPHTTAILAHDGEVSSVGITTVFDAMRVGTIAMTGVNGRRYARALASELLDLVAKQAFRARHLIHLRAEVCSESLAEELAEFSPDDRVGLVSLMDHTPGQRQFRDLDQLRAYYIGKHGCTEGEFAQLVITRQNIGARNRDAHQQTTLAAAKRLGARLASHDDTTPDHVRASCGMGISLAEFPTTLAAAEACRDAGISIIMGAPNLIRGASHSGNVSALDLAERGLLDIVSSDYAPSLLLASAFRLGALWGDLPRAVRTVSATPAEATGLNDRGLLCAGLLGDVVRVRMLGDTPAIRSVWRGGVQIG